MEKRDYKDLIIASDELEKMDKALQMLTGFGHSEGIFRDLDKIYEVLQRNSKYYDKEDDDLNDEFFVILLDKSKSVEERADLLLNEY